jgi:hypothetical protein
VIARIETRARGVSLDEALILAAALDVSLLHLIAPREDNEMVQVTPEVTVLTWEFRSWLRGIDPLPGQDEQAFATAIPASEWRERSGRRAEAERAVARIEHQLRVLRAKARLFADDLAEIEGPYGARGLAELSPQFRRLESKLNAVYDQMAELAVDLEDARAKAAELRRLEAAIESTLPMEPLRGPTPSAGNDEEQR